MSSKKNVAIVYHYIAHYRIPLFNLLSQNKINNYTIYADTKPDIKIKVASEKLAKIPIDKGGIRWKMLDNYWFFKFFLWQSGVMKLVFDKKIDTIIFLGNMYYFSTWIGAILGRLNGKKIIFWTHGFLKEEKNLKGFIRVLFYGLAHKLLVYGNRAKEILISKGYNDNKIDLIYNSLDYDSQIKIRNRKENYHVAPCFGSKFPVIGFIGRVTYKKQIDQLISVINKLKLESKPVNLIIIGSGEAIPFLKEMVNKFKLEKNILFYGPCYNEEEIFSLMSQMNVIVSPGEVGLTAIHALTFGVPIITHNDFASQGPEFEVIIPGETGDFFEKNSLKSLERYVVKWVFSMDREKHREQCYKVIDSKYNPYHQVSIFNSVV